MDRAIVYDAALPQVTDILNSNKFAMIGQAFLNSAILGNSTVVAGLACTPTVPASLQVNVGVGSIYQTDPADAAAYGDLGIDNASLVKQGILSTPSTLTITPPSTPGFSQVFLVQAILQDVDGGSTVLSYYNAANPAQPWSGPANSGTSQFTIRRCNCAIALKAGTAATTGTQITPSPDAGYVGLYAITVANGAATITSANIVTRTTAPFFPTLPAVPADVQNGAWVYAVDTSTGGAPLATTGSTSTSSAILSFASVPSWVTAGMSVADLTTPGAITSSQTVLSKTGTTVTLTGNVDATVNSSDLIAFSFNAMVASVSPPPASLGAGLAVRIKSSSTNTGAATFNLNGLGAVAMRRANGNTLSAGDIASGEIVHLVYDGSVWQAVNFLGAGSGGGGSNTINTISIPYATAGGTANAITASFTPAITSLSAGTTVEVKIASPNTAAVTIAVNALGAVAITDQGGVALKAGALVAGEVALLIFDGTNFQVAPRQLQTLAPGATLTLYVRPSGNDSHDGSVNDDAHAFATIQGAITFVTNSFVITGHTITIQLGTPGTYTGSVKVSGISGTIAVKGDIAAQSSYIISFNPNSGTTQVVAVSGATLILSGVTLNNLSTAFNTLTVSFLGNVDMDHITFGGANTSGASDIAIFQLGNVVVSDAITFARISNSAISCAGGSYTSAAWVTAYTIGGGVSWANAFVSVTGLGQISITSGWSSFSGSGTGLRYTASLNSIINTSGGGATFLPGDTPGTTATGGQYA